MGLLFGWVEGDTAAPELFTLKLAGSVSDAPRDIPRMSLGRNFFLHDGARRKFLSSSWGRREKEGLGEEGEGGVVVKEHRETKQTTRRPWMILGVCMIDASVYECVCEAGLRRSETRYESIWH